jgi:pyridoxal/pyridoxine/pyridoxamine kinase
MMFHHYTKLIYLAQTDDEKLQDEAKRAADFLGLEYEYRFTGYGDLTTSLLSAARTSSPS